MAILRSSDGKFYDISDDHLEGSLIPAEMIKEKLGSVGPGNGPSEGPVGPSPEMMVPGTGGQVVIQIYTSAGESGGGYEAVPAGVECEVEAHGYCWRRNYFNNCWRRNCWRNSCYR